MFLIHKFKALDVGSYQTSPDRAPGEEWFWHISLMSLPTTQTPFSLLLISLHRIRQKWHRLLLPGLAVSFVEQAPNSSVPPVQDVETGSRFVLVIYI